MCLQSVDIELRLWIRKADLGSWEFSGFWYLWGSQNHYRAATKRPLYSCPKESILLCLILRSKNQVAKTVTGRSTSVNVQKYLLSSPVLVYVYISFENVRVVNETVNLWCVFWKNYISFSFYSVRQLTIFFASYIYLICKNINVQLLITAKNNPSCTFESILADFQYSLHLNCSLVVRASVEPSFVPGLWEFRNSWMWIVCLG